MFSTDIQHIGREISPAELDDPQWDTAEAVGVATYWSGEKAPAGRHFSARLLWSDTSLYVRFNAVQDEPLIVSESPRTDAKTHGLWERDVCELFVAPDKGRLTKYFEFEVAPTGEWIDLALEVTPAGRVADLQYASQMSSAASIRDGEIVMAMRIPFAAFGRTPSAGEPWAGNLYRCVGRDPSRGYLAWSPTRTSWPSFHVPEAFGKFNFVDRS